MEDCREETQPWRAFCVLESMLGVFVWVVERESRVGGGESQQGGP